MLAWSPPLSVERDTLHYIVMVTSWVEDQLRCLALAKLIDRIDRRRVLSLLSGDIEAPRTESEPAEVLAECRRRPSFSAVGGNVNRTNAIAAVPGNAADGKPSRLDFGAIAMAGDQGIHHHFGDRCAGRVFLAGEPVPDRKFGKRNAVRRIHPEAALRLGYGVDRNHVLHP